MAENIDPYLIKTIIGHIDNGFSNYTISKTLSVKYDTVARVAMMYVEAGGSYRKMQRMHPSSTGARKSGYVKKPRPLPNHGTSARYGGKHKCRCTLCVSSNTRRCYEAKLKRDRQRAMGIANIPHGTDSGYRNWGCLCGPCKEAGRETNRKALETPVATQWNKGQRWVPDEQKKTYTYDSTARELAMSIGRTTSAVHAQRGKMWQNKELSTTK